MNLISPESSPNKFTAPSNGNVLGHADFTAALEVVHENRQAEGGEDDFTPTSNNLIKMQATGKHENQLRSDHKHCSSSALLRVKKSLSLNKLSIIQPLKVEFTKPLIATDRGVQNE